MLCVAAHKRGRAGGGWESDEEGQDTPASPLTSEMDLSPGPPSSHSSSDAHSSGAAEEMLLNILTDSKLSWPRSRHAGRDEPGMRYPQPYTPTRQDQQQVFKALHIHH